MQEARDLWRTAHSLEMAAESKAKKSNSPNETELAQLIGTGLLNVEHLESNPPEVFIDYLQTSIPAAITHYKIPPFSHSNQPTGLSLTI